MMNVAHEERNRNVYENFEVEKDILFFKVGRLGLVSFHGRNYNIKKQLPNDQLNVYISSGLFVNVHSNYYVNLDKIVALEDGCLRFDQGGAESKVVQVPRWRQSYMKNLIVGRKHRAI
ncbi:hypothetical protein [Paenibacillus sp. GCM10027626]|uniref:hypothetical protein n=1 Tax=Paenibacillus sp. GCM10027626 TaxID=3273411 RepID=UPI00363521BC